MSAGKMGGVPINVQGKRLSDMMAPRSNAPGGSPRPAADYSKRERGDGTGRAMGAAAAPLQSVDLFGEVVKPDPRGILKDRFIMPPFTVLNAREGDWQERKRKWLAIGIKSELGRGGEMIWNETFTWTATRRLTWC